jgi:hypothetical protein
MVDEYREMYLHLFNKISDAIVLLQEAQQAAEEKYLSLGGPELRLVEPMLPEDQD